MENKIALVNNTGIDTRIFDKVILECVKGNKELPIELTEDFTLEIIEDASRPYGRYGILRLV